MEISCPNCHAIYQVTPLTNGQPPRFCMSCGGNLEANETESKTNNVVPKGSDASSITLVAGHLPQKEEIQFTIGPYQILNSIGKGGMGEVYLAYDTSCGRRIALKRIRTDLLEHQQMHNRFLKEARVTSQLTHPAIIAIYEIHDERQLAYYTMPYVEGETLKQLLKTARINEKKGVKIEHSMTSIPSLIRIFLSVCQAVGYAHSKSVLHRDLKPENIIVGQYGEVLILDWGLAKLIHGDEKENGERDLDEPPEKSDSGLRGLTNLGKVVGTVSYMAPERALGNPAAVQTDIYSLGVILYQILTLRYPFHRKTLKEFRKNHQKEHLIPPAVIAPHRDVPEILAQIAMKCLSKDPTQRYQSVDELLYQLESYIEGRPEWFVAAELDIAKKSDWEFQENVLIAEHIAITQAPEMADWVNLMISKESFDQNTRIEAEVFLGEKSSGLGFLLSIPEAAERSHLNDGYTLWLGSDLNPSTKLLRSTVEVLYAPDIVLGRNERHRIRIEKVENHINCYINESLQFSYLELVPMVGTHVGLLSRDGDFKIEHLKISVGGHNITVNCLAVPDAFLAHKDYLTALSEYRRIGNSFPGRAEGREALFRAGMTLLEQAKNAPTGAEKEQLYDQTFEEFEKLHNGAGAPLEYLGKALVYQSMGDYDEEVKCFELALRRYPQHPLLGGLKEQIFYRMHESSRFSRSLTYKFVLLVIRMMPEAAATTSAKNLFDSLNRHWESLYFFEEDFNGPKDLTIASKLSFWLAKTHTLHEIIEETAKINPFPIKSAANALFCLIELGAWKIAAEAIEKLQSRVLFNAETKESLNLLKIAIQANKQSNREAVEAVHQLPQQHFNKQYDRLILYLMKKTLDDGDNTSFHKLDGYLTGSTLAPDNELLANCCRVWAALSEGNWNLAGEILQGYPLELVTNESSPLHFLYGCWLYVTEGPEITSVHFASVFDHSTPRSWTLFSHYYNGKIGQSWYSKAFLWEKKQLYRQMALFYHCSGEENLAANYRRLSLETVIEE